MSESNTRHPTPAHVSLAVVFQVRGARLHVLLWQRAQPPFKGAWALPGGYLERGETLEQSIRKHLAEKVDVRELSHLEQLETLSDPKRFAPEWQLATAYLGLVPRDLDPELPDDTSWHAVDSLPRLAFDHGSIVLAGRERLRAKLSYTNLGFALAPAEFTISELRDLYAAALGHDVSANEPPARPPAPRRTRSDGRAARIGPDRRPAGLAIPLPEPAPGDHRSVRRPPAAGTRTRLCRISSSRLVLSVAPCYGQFVPGEKEVDNMTIALASFCRATRL